MLMTFRETIRSMTHHQVSRNTGIHTGDSVPVAIRSATRPLLPYLHRTAKCARCISVSLIADIFVGGSCHGAPAACAGGKGEQDEG